MKDKKTYYWKGIEELRNDPGYVKHAEKEFPEYLPIKENKSKAANENSGSNRRDFLKMMGFGISAATLAACEAPVRKAIPYLNKPVEILPGIANYYASTYIQGGDYCSIVIKTREGRPIKVEGNELSPLTKGGTSAQVEASVLSLYDDNRLKEPLIKKQTADWDALDATVINKLKELKNSGKPVVILSNTILSPSSHKVIEGFIEKYPNAKWVTYDPVSYEGLSLGNQLTFGEKMIPSYAFDKSMLTVSLGADFMGTWLSPVQFSRDFASTRRLKDNESKMSRLYAFESNLSLTGANADYRTPVKPSDQGLVTAALYNAIARKAGQTTIQVNTGEFDNVEKAANDLWKNRGKSLVVSGSNDPEVQALVNAINFMLNNYGNTIDTSRPMMLRQGNDRQMDDFVTSLKAGQVGGVIILDANPVYDHPMGVEIGKALSKASLTVSCSYKLDETASLTEYIAPINHYLESWNDAEPLKGHFSLMQPGITRIFKTRQSEESLLKWSEATNTDYFQFVKDRWQSEIFAQQNKETDFQRFWDKTLYEGVLDMEVESTSPEFKLNVTSLANGIQRNYSKKGNGLELELYQSIAIGTGREANNPWLQEMPDPLTKACWDNYVTVSYADAETKGLKMVDNNTYKVNLKVGDQVLVLPAIIQPGQAKGTIGVALGYGRQMAGSVGNAVGVNVYPLVRNINGTRNYFIPNADIEITGEAYQIAQTQTHHTYMDRESIIQSATYDHYKENAYAGRYQPYIHTKEWLDEKIGVGEADGHVDPLQISLWKGHSYNNHHWVMGIDMTTCIGCGACTIACQAENNIPTVGRQEVLNRREMHWIRIDRYYSASEEATTNKELEKAAENPEVYFQPMLCQQCNNAPCETVCPVVATTHSTEGLNQMTYNRCVGTRYCANNCPYKVRRFNWFKYHDNSNFSENTSMNSVLGKMVLNPDVTVRSRGVMEKCTFCVQRIQGGKLQAKKEGRRPHDGEINTACAKACPTEAIVFGDINDPNSKISKLLKPEYQPERKLMKEPRAFAVLHEIRTEPNVYYLTKIVNKDEDLNKKEAHKEHKG